MYPVKVKDFTRLGGWLALFAVLTALRSVNCLLALVRIPLQLATYGTYGMGLYYVLEGINLVVGALGVACIVLLAQRKGAALRRVFLITGAVNIAVFGMELAGLIAFFAQGSVIAESLLASVQQAVYYGIWYLYLLRSRRAAVYFGEAQPMWYECGCFAPYGAQPPFGAPGQPPYGYGPQGPAQAYSPGAVPAQAPGAPAQPAAPQTPAAAPQPGAGPQGPAQAYGPGAARHKRRRTRTAAALQTPAALQRARAGPAQAYGPALPGAGARRARTAAAADARGCPAAGRGPQGPAQAYGPGAAPAQRPAHRTARRAADAYGYPAAGRRPRRARPGVRPRRCPGTGARRTRYSPPRRRRPRLPAAGRRPQGPAQAYGPGAAPAQAPGTPAQPAAPQTPAAAPQPGAGPQAGPPQASPVQHTPAGGMVCPACGMQGLPGASFCTVCGARLVPAAQGGPAQGRVQTKEDEPHV
ncbi:MAG: hypothetical protein ACLVKK_07360 [Ruthenibacterium sp.]